jgi:hypothetical protein
VVYEVLFLWKHLCLDELACLWTISSDAVWAQRRCKSHCDFYACNTSKAIRHRI